MKKRIPKDSDIAGLMSQIQAQLAVLDRKLDSFMTKSLTELAQARATQKPVQVVPTSVQTSPRPNEQRPGRPMYAVICFDCGKNTEIPFKPSGDRPVYCKECFAKRKAGNAPRVNVQPSSAPSFSPPAASVIEIRSSDSKKKPSSVKKSAAKKKVVAKKKTKKR